jgi:hypothetical protein
MTTSMIAFVVICVIHDYMTTVNTNSSIMPSSHKHGHNHITTNPCDINNISLEEKCVFSTSVCN